MGIQINQLTATDPSASQSLPVYDPAKGACPYLRDPALACLKARGL